MGGVVVVFDIKPHMAQAGFELAVAEDGSERLIFPYLPSAVIISVWRHACWQCWG